MINRFFQNEMQTLRNRLTVAETKLLERDVEIKNYEEENKTLKDAMENLAEKASISSQKSNNQQFVNDGSKFILTMDKIDGTPLKEWILETLKLYLNCFIN